MDYEVLVTLKSLPVSRLYRICRELFGAGRYERELNKSEAIDYILTADADAIRAAIDATTGGESAPREPRKPVASAAPAADPSASSREGALLQALRDAIGASVDAEQVRSIVRDELQGVTQAAPIELHAPDREPVTIPPGTDPTVARCVALLRAGLQPLLIGPAGCGKSTIAKQAAQLLGVRFDSASLTAGTPEAELIGRVLPDESGAWNYRPSPFTAGYEGGDALFLFDELGAADPNMLLVVNQALANGGFTLSLRREAPHFARASTWYAIAAANTVNGAAGAYAGQGALDASTLDRFFPLAVDYSGDYERALAGLPVQAPRSWEPEPPRDRDAMRRACYAWTQSCRDYIQRRGLAGDCVVSTRWLERAIAARDAGLSPADVRESLTLTWPEDARADAPVLEADA